MVVAPMSVFLARLGRWGGYALVREDGTEEEVLNDRKFAKHLSLVHLEHPGVDFIPCFDTRNVVQHGGMPPERRRLDRVDELYAGEVHVVLRVFVDDVRVMDRFRPNVLVTRQLSRAEKERKEMIVVKSPNTMRSGRFQPVRGL